jgi:hypothetical protein
MKVRAKQVDLRMQHRHECNKSRKEKAEECDFDGMEPIAEKLRQNIIECTDKVYHNCPENSLSQSLLGKPTEKHSNAENSTNVENYTRYPGNFVGNVALGHTSGTIAPRHTSGVFPEMRHIKLSSAYFGEEEAAAVARVLRTQVVNMGAEVKAFEEELHTFFDRPEAEVTCIHSCTAALLLAAQSCGLTTGDEVLVPTLTFVSTFQAIKATGALPIPCDIDMDDGFISLKDAEKRLTPRTNAIVPVLYAGCS